MGRVVHFEINADDPARAAKFYGDTFGWQIQKWGGPIEYWLVTTGPQGTAGIDGAIQRRSGTAGSGSPTGYVCTIDVDDLDAALGKATAAGATVASPKHPVPGIGWVAYATDTEGNLFAMMQSAGPGQAG